jgi:hypothetical protein
MGPHLGASSDLFDAWDASPGASRPYRGDCRLIVAARRERDLHSAKRDSHSAKRDSRSSNNDPVIILEFGYSHANGGRRFRPKRPGKPGDFHRCQLPR